MFCSNCGKEIQAGDKFCMTCGWRVPTGGEAQPTVAQAAETQPGEAQPAEAKAAEIQPAEAQAVETQSVETQAAEVKPAEAQVAEAQSAETQSAEAQAAEVKPAEAQAAETQPAEAQSAETQAAEAQATEVKPAEAQATEIKPAETQPGQQVVAAAPQTTSPVTTASQEKPKKKKKGIFVAIGSVAALAVAGIAVAFNWGFINNFMMRTFYPAEKYYQHVEQENVDAAVASAASAYNAYLLEPLSSISDRYQSYLDGTMKGEDISYSGEVTLTLGELGQKMIKAASPDTYEMLDLKNLNSVTAYYEIAQSGDWVQMLLGIGLQGTRIFTIDSYMDDRDDAIYVGIPELSDKYLSAKMSAVFPEWEEYQEIAQANAQEAVAYVQILEEIAAKLPDEKQAKELMAKYGKVILECLSDVEKKSGVNLKAGSVSQKCTKLDVTIDGKTLAKIVKKLCDELKDDKEFKKIFIGVVEGLADASKSLVDMYDYPIYGIYDYDTLDIDAEELYEEFQAICENLIENADELKDLDIELVMSVYVDGNGKVRGRSLGFEYDDTECQLLIANPQDGKETGYKVEFVMTEDDETAKVLFEGSYKESGGKLDGKFVMTVDAEDEKMDLWQLTVKQLDKASMEKGYINGSFSVKLSEDLLREMDVSGYMAGKLADMEFCLDMSSSQDEAKCEFKLMEDGGLWGSIIVSGKTEKGKKISAPSDAIQIKDIYDEEDYFKCLEKYWDSIDWKAYKEKLKEAGLPEEFVSGLEEVSDISLEDLLWMLY